MDPRLNLPGISIHKLYKNLHYAGRKSANLRGSTRHLCVLREVARPRAYVEGGWEGEKEATSLRAQMLQRTEFQNLRSQ